MKAMDLTTKVWLANEVRVWGLAAAAIIGIISFAAAWTHTRLQAELSAENERIAQDKQRESNEKIALALNDAAQANAKAADAELRLAQLTMPRGMLLKSNAAFREALKGRPDFKVQIFWLRSVSDGEYLAWRITNCLYDGEDVTRTLEVVPRQWKVIETVREKFSCRDCQKISQAPAPFHAIPRGWAGPSLLAMIMFEKFGQHQPLNRQAERYALEGVPIALSTMADAVPWIPSCAASKPM
jgi:hypothetical protein